MYGAVFVAFYCNEVYIHICYCSKYLNMLSRLQGPVYVVIAASYESSLTTLCTGCSGQTRLIPWLLMPWRRKHTHGISNALRARSCHPWECIFLVVKGIMQNVNTYINGLMQDSGNSIANAPELPPSCTKPSLSGPPDIQHAKDWHLPLNLHVTQQRRYVIADTPNLPSRTYSYHTTTKSYNLPLSHPLRRQPTLFNKC